MFRLTAPIQQTVVFNGHSFPSALRISLPKTREGTGNLHNTNLEERPDRRTGRVTQNSHVACTTNSRSTAMTCKTRINNDRQERETGKKLGQNYDFYLQMNRPS